MGDSGLLQRWAIWVAACAAVLLALQFPVLDPADGIRADGVVYVGGARSLLAGEGYRYSVFEGSPRIGLYPPGWSMVLVPAVALSDVTGWGGWIQIWSIACSLVLVHGGVRFLGGRGMPIPMAAGVMLSIVLTPVWRDGIRWAFSEPLFMAVLYAWLLPAAWERPLGSTRDWFRVGLACAALLLTRSVGVAVLPAVGVASLMTRRPASVVAAIGPPILVMIGWAAWCRGLVGYGEMFESEITRLTGTADGRGILFSENARHLLQGGPVVNGLFPALFPVPQSVARMIPPVRALPWILAAVVQYVAVAAMLLAMCRPRMLQGHATDIPWPRVGAITGTAAVYFGLVLASPVPVGSLPRYMLPLAPLVAWGIWEAMKRLTGDRPHALRRVGQIATAVLALNIGSAVALSRTGFPGADGVRSKDDLIEITRRIRSMAGGGEAPRVAVDIRNPLLDMVDVLGRRVVTDYVDPLDVWQPVRHKDQGYVRADYLVIEAREVAGRPVLDGLPRVAANRSYVAYRLDPDWEAGFRRERGIPGPR